MSPARWLLRTAGPSHPLLPGPSQAGSVRRRILPGASPSTGLQRGCSFLASLGKTQIKEPLFRHVPPARAVAVLSLVAAAAPGHLAQALPAPLCPCGRWDGGEPWALVMEEQFAPRLVQPRLGVAVLPREFTARPNGAAGQLPKPAHLPWGGLSRQAGWSRILLASLTCLAPTCGDQQGP